jgi:hypothetical protein
MGESEVVQSSFRRFVSQRDNYLNYIISTIFSVISIVGPREPGSAAERAAQNIFQDHLKRSCDSVGLELFDCHPHTLMGWVCVDAFGLIFAVFFYNYDFRLVSFVLTTLCMLFFVLEFVCYYEFLDPLFPKRVSANVIAVRKPRGDVKRRAIFNGHCDSNWEWWYNYLGGGHLLAFVVVMAIGGMVVFWLLQIVFWTKYRDWIGILEIFWLPFYFSVLFFTNWNRVVPGANDNLTGCLMALTVAKYLKDNEIRFENTEVQVVLTGCEESGLRGAKRWVQNHRDGIETAFFCFDTIRDFDYMGVYYRDLNGTVAHDMRVCSIMKRASQLAGWNIEYRILFFGSSDATAITQGGLPAATFAAMDPTPASYYHARTDDTDNMDPKTIKAGLDIAIGSLLIFDQDGLDGPIVN